MTTKHEVKVGQVYADNSGLEVRVRIDRLHAEKRASGFSLVAA